jgi:NAD(P)-dependent dehydrogenase (short-subunit alcohol dehydrogenase family)
VVSFTLPDRDLLSIPLKKNILQFLYNQLFNNKGISMSKVVIVTGGNRGIGAATSKLLASKGYSVCVNYRTRSEEAEQVVSEIKVNGGCAFAFAADVSNENEVINLFDTTERELGPITHLVNNAGVLFTQSRLADLSVERFNKVLTINVISCFLCCREAVKRMTKGGAIVNVSSVASRTGSPNEYIDYAASKGAMDTLTKGLSIEVGSEGIRVNCVRPGFIYTEMHADGGEPNRVQRLSSQIPLQRGGTPEEVANSIAWLLSDDASYVTGSFVDVAGGK